MPHKIKKIILLFGDLTTFYLSLYLTLQIAYPNNLSGETLVNHFIPFTGLLFLWIIIFYISGLYNLNISINNPYFSKLLFKSFFISLMISFVFFYLSVDTQITPKTNLLIFSLIFLVLTAIWRYTFNLLLKSYLPKTNIAIIGLDENTKNIVSAINEKKFLGNRLIFIFDANSNEKKFSNTPVFNDIGKLKELLIKKRIDTIILPNNNNKIQKIRSILFSCIKYRINFIEMNHFYENITGKISLYTINKSWFLENLNEGDKKWFTFLKRQVDLVFSFILFMASIIFWPIIGIIIKLESKGTVFFKQKRIGRYGKIFSIYKFRTMKTEENNFSPTAKIDPRITKFGSFLRKTRIDEIPQIINIIKGEMSFVGPRPERPELAKKLRENIPFYNERTLINPGITGWDQISGEYHSPDVEDTIKKLQYDLYYIKNRSAYFDLSIALKTIATVLSSAGR